MLHACLQDTRRLLQAEAAAVALELKRRESAARLESDKHSAAEVRIALIVKLIYTVMLMSQLHNQCLCALKLDKHSRLYY